MINKTILLLFLPLVLSQTVSIPKLLSFADSFTELPQYGEIKAYGGTIIYLSLEGFKTGDKVYLEFSFDNGYYLVDDSLTVAYLESNELVSSGSVKYSYSNSYSKVNTKYTLYFSIELTGDYKYLIFAAPRIEKSSSGVEITTYYTIRHTKSSIITIIIVLVIIVVILVIVGILFFLYRRRKRQDLTYQTGYQAQPGYQTQPGYQAPSAY